LPDPEKWDIVSNPLEPVARCGKEAYFYALPASERHIPALENISKWVALPDQFPNPPALVPLMTQ
jgi:hypothetical protein